MPCSADPDVRWLAPPKCPQQSSFARALRSELGDSQDLQQLEKIDVRIRRSAAHGYELTLSTQHKRSAAVALRRLHTRNCAELVPAAVWLIALAVCPSGEAGDGEGKHVRAPSVAIAQGTSAVAGPEAAFATGEVAADALSVEPSATPPVAARSTRDHTSFAAVSARAPATLDASPVERPNANLHIGLAGLGGVLGGAGVAAQGTIGFGGILSVGVFHTQASVIEVLPAQHGIAHAGTVHLSSLALGVSECALWGSGVRVGPCGGMALLRTSAWSQDFGYDAHRVVFWGMLELGLRMLWRLSSSLELSLSGAIGTPLSPRPRFTVSGAGAVATVARWSQAAQLGLIYVIR
jgi:hypothetical protein